MATKSFFTKRTVQLLCCGVLWVLCTTAASAQVSTRRVRELVSSAADQVEKDDTDQIYLIQIDFVQKDGTSAQTYSVSSSNRYRVVAIGDDNRIKDLDLYVLDQYGNEVAKDSDNKNLAVVSFRPSSSGAYKFRVKPYSMVDGANDGFYGLIISRIR
jgi:hypothetical protein